MGLKNMVYLRVKKIGNDIAKKFDLRMLRTLMILLYESCVSKYQIYIETNNEDFS